MKRLARLTAAVFAWLWAIPAFAQTPPPQSQTIDPEVTQVEDVIVVGSSLERRAKEFVAAVSAPSIGRDAATWRGRVCVGVGGMRAEPALALADRVSDWAHSMGLDVAAPGCTPNVFIVATSDGDETARALVAARPRDFRTGASGTDRGSAALRNFQQSGAPIRWWHVSLPVNEDRGTPAVRLPGQAPVEVGQITRPSDLGAFGATVLPSRVSDHVRDDLQQVIIVVDSRAVEKASFNQLAEYISMVALAQIDPEALPEAPSILNLFDPEKTQEETLSRWDQAYLRALYTTRLGNVSQNANMSLIAAATATELQNIEE